MDLEERGRKWKSGEMAGKGAHREGRGEAEVEAPLWKLLNGRRGSSEGGFCGPRWSRVEIEMMDVSCANGVVNH
ncbi:hypothetical protein MHYP_G00033230 [Metynnis hypsauchen]